MRKRTVTAVSTAMASDDVEVYCALIHQSSVTSVDDGRPNVTERIHARLAAASGAVNRSANFVHMAR
jgi:hypothetical protein